MGDIIRKICGADLNKKWRTHGKQAVVTPELREVAVSGFQRNQRVRVVLKWGSSGCEIWMLWPLICWTKTLRLICNVTYNINQILHLRFWCGRDGRLRTKDFQVISSKTRETNSVKTGLFWLRWQSCPFPGTSRTTFTVTQCSPC